MNFSYLFNSLRHKERLPNTIGLQTMRTSFVNVFNKPELYVASLKFSFIGKHDIITFCCFCIKKSQIFLATNNGYASNTFFQLITLTWKLDAGPALMVLYYMHNSTPLKLCDC